MPGSCVDSCLAWRYDEILSRLRRAGARVAAVLCGHDHAGGYARDPASGTHHVCFQSPLEADGAQGLCHAIVDVHDDVMLLRGAGAQATMRLPLGELRA